MNYEEIRNIILKAIYSQKGLMDELVLKGGNALSILGVTSRQSQDLDFSIREKIKYTKENEGKLLKKAVTRAFSEYGYLVNSFSFKEKPKKRSDNIPPFWGGYSVTFSIINKEKYKKEIATKKDNLNRYAEELLDGTKKIEIDISFDEYTEGKVAKKIDDTTIFLYSPLMIVYEKIRASCQQLDDYKLTSSKVRSRDLYDIYKTLTTYKFMDLREEVLNPKNFYILKKMFELKEVPLDLLYKLDSKKDELKYDYEVNVKPQIPKNEDIEDFDYLFFYNSSLFKEVFDNL